MFVENLFENPLDSNELEIQTCVPHGSGKIFLYYFKIWYLKLNIYEVILYATISRDCS